MPEDSERKLLDNWQNRTSTLAKEADASLESIFADLTTLYEQRTALDPLTFPGAAGLLNQLCSTLMGMGQVWPANVRRGLLNNTLITANSLLLWVALMHSSQELQQLRSKALLMPRFERSEASPIAPNIVPGT